MLAESGLPIISADTMAEAAQKVVAAVAKISLTEGINHVDPHQQRHQGHHPGHHRQDRPVPHRECHDYANGKNCFVAGVNPKKAGERSSNIPIFASVKEAAKRRPAPPSR